MTDEAEVEKSFWLTRPDGWVINRKMKKIVLFEFKRTSDAAESWNHTSRTCGRLRKSSTLQS